MWRYLTYAIIIILFMLIETYGQDKIERERRIKKSEVPENAREWMRDAFEGVRKIRWYFEETSGKSSYEAKLKWQGQRTSVEFDTSGIIEDIEREIDFQDLNSDLKNHILSYFGSTYNRFEIRRIQEQWTGGPEDLEDAVDEDEINSIVIKYEIEYYGTNSEEKSLWEGLFDATGNFIEKRKIVLRPADNLNF